MKLKFFTLFFFSAVVTLSLSCRKAELLQPDPAKIIQLNITGASDVALEYLYKDSIIATPPVGSINVKTLLSVKGENATLKVRKKGTSEILLTKTITAIPFDQNISLFYDGTKIYNSAISLIVKGFALSGEIEFLLDGKLLSSGTSIINSNFFILIDKGTSREITIRKKGTTEILFTKTIESEIARQNIDFFFDGTKITNNVKLTPPANPANMMISAKFETIFAPQFKNVDVDIVFYTKPKSATITTAGTKVTPELRLTLKKDGSFNSIELPALPGPDYIYSFDVFESGTNNVPYTTTASPFVNAAFPFKQNEGRYGAINFEANASKLFIIKDTKNLASTTRSTYFSGAITDLSEYFR